MNGYEIESVLESGNVVRFIKSREDWLVIVRGDNGSKKATKKNPVR